MGIKDYEISFLGHNSYFNRTCKDPIEINITSGKILMIIYLIDINDKGLSY